MSVSLIVLIIWAWILSEKEQYIMPLRVNVDVVEYGMGTGSVHDDILFEYAHNDAKVLVTNPPMEYSIENVMSIATIAKGRYGDEADVPILAIAYANGDLEFYSPEYDAIDSPTLLQDSLHLDQPIVAMTFLDTTLIALTLNSHSYIDVHWIQYLDGTWVDFDVFPTQIQLSHIDTIFPLGEKGVFLIDNKRDVYFIDIQRRTIEKKYEDVILENVLGSATFYVLHYLTTHGLEYFTVNILDEVITLKNNMYSQEARPRNDVTLMMVQEREVAFSFSDTMYTIGFP